MARATTDMQGGGGSKKSAPAKIKVGQDVIDFIKAQGMSASLKRVGSMSASERSRDAEYAEGVRRMYGDRRFQDATRTSHPAAPTAPRYTSPDNARAGKTAPKYSSADAARRSAK